MKLPTILAVLGLLAGCGAAFGLATEHVGPEESAVAQLEWPKGMVEVVRHPSRVYSVWVNGNENFYFQATLDDIKQLVALFCKARMRDHEIRIEAGPQTAKSFGGDEYEYNVSLHVLGGIALAMTRMKESGETLEPSLTIYVGPDHSLLKQLKVPENAVVNCGIEGVEIQSKASKPRRTPWYGRIQVDDSSPGADPAHRLSIRVTLWDNDSPDGILLATVGPPGVFEAALSDAEMAALKKGTCWLTVTVGNYTTEAKKQDARFPPELLARVKDEASPLKIASPKYYYGRILFEDGSPPILDPVPWPGAEIHPDFPYAGIAKLDAEGYFKAFFSPDQFEKLKVQKARKNIHIPTEKQGQFAALETYPPALLSQDKAKAGVVKIPKPAFNPQFDPAKAPSLLGKALPALQGLGLDPSPAAIRNRIILLCFFDLQQRPSRYCLSALAKSAEELKAKGVYAAAIQTTTVDKPVLENFARTNHVPFPLGMITAEEEKTRFNWGLRSQPWLILTDQAHLVRAEGFQPGELSEKLAALR